MNYHFLVGFHARLNNPGTLSFYLEHEENENYQQGVRAAEKFLNDASRTPENPRNSTMTEIDELLAASAVQGEPVGEAGSLPGTKGFTTAVFESRKVPEGTKLYTAPQPPFQLPDFATDPDDSDEVASLWDHGFKRGWNSCLGAVAKAMQSAPDELSDYDRGFRDGKLDRLIDEVVAESELVEALSALRGCIMETRGPDAHSALVLADAALAAHRKQQEPSHDRPPYVRAVADFEQTNLPDKKTCGDCIHCRRCCAIYGHIPADEVCDWSPSRFREAKPEGDQP